MRWLLILALLFSQCPSALAGSSHRVFNNVSIEYCHDGDTCTGYSTTGEKLKIRFSGIDAPELSQLGGPQSRDYLLTLIKGSTVELDCIGRSYNRLTCSVSRQGRDIQKEMVTGGWAWDYYQFSRGKYRLPMDEAKAAKRGLWALSSASSPYCFRHSDKATCSQDPSYQP